MSTQYTPLIEALLEPSSKISWFGYSSMARTDRTGCDGTSTAFSANYKGLTMRIAHVEYWKSGRERNPDMRLPDQEPIEFYELEIKDPSARCGRRIPLQLTRFLSDCPDWEPVSRLFAGIKKKSPVYVLNQFPRMEDTATLLALARLIGKKAPSK